jgi:hypothetical protein
MCDRVCVCVCVLFKKMHVLNTETNTVLKYGALILMYFSVKIFCLVVSCTKDMKLLM